MPTPASRTRALPMIHSVLRRLLGAVLLAAAATTSVDAAEVLDRIIVIVNDGVILQSELDRAITEARKTIAQRGIASPPADALRTQVLERLILVRLQTQRAQQAGIRIDDRELNEVLNGIASQNGMTLAEFADALRADGMDFLAVREQVRDEVLVQRLRSKEVESRVLVTDADIELFLASQGPNEGLEYHLYDILVAVPEGATAETRAKARAKAEELLKDIRAGKDFAQVAIASSDGQQALQGGDLDWRKAADLPGVFAEQAAKLAPGTVSEVVEAPGGFHIVKLAGTRGGEQRKTVNETHARHILIQPNAVRTEEQARLQARDLYDRIVAGEDFAELAKKYSDDASSKNGGGDLGFQPPGVFAPEFQVRLDQLKPGEVSPPFHTQFGWHVASVLERRTRDTTDESRRARARQAVGQRKSAEEYDVWLRRLREEAYIEYRQPGDAEAQKG
jgi:peptidyl-prolyl cis-trans isomerase SurA